MLLRVGTVIAIAVIVKLGYDWLTARIALLEASAAARAMSGLIVTALIAYAVLIAIPFVPGVEVGLALLMLMGAKIAPFVYLATVTGMSLAFLTGQYASLQWLRRFCADMRQRRLCALLTQIEETDQTDRLTSLSKRLPNWLAPILVDYRYVTVAILFNLPGNIAIGGGGGIMMAAGLSRLFRTRWMLLTIALATLPLPLLVWLSGGSILH